MKLYTEEQVDIMLSRARMQKQDDTYMFTNEYLLSQETPIEIPSDLQDFHKWIEDNEWYFNPISFNGVIKYRWVRKCWCGQETTNELYKIFIEEQILNQNK